MAIERLLSCADIQEKMPGIKRKSKIRTLLIETLRVTQKGVVSFVFTIITQN
jgi:hypothetical protein